MELSQFEFCQLDVQGAEIYHSFNETEPFISKMLSCVILSNYLIFQEIGENLV